jgi:hypothetical protein
LLKPLDQLEDADADLNSGEEMAAANAPVKAAANR